MLKWFNNPEEQEQDRQLFAAGEALLDAEGMELFLATLREEKAYQPHLRRRVLAYMRCCEETAPRFRDRQLREKGKELARALKELRVHTATHFHIFPRDQKGDDQRHALHPDYFILEMNEVSFAEHQFYCKAESDLLRLVEKTAAAYRAFRATADRRKIRGAA